jgi:hypothetical protein
MFKTLSRFSALIILGVGITSYLVILFNAQPLYFQNDFFPSGIMAVRDDIDKSIHFERAQWYLEDKIPYKEVFSEYPQIITYLFAVPAIFTSELNTYINIYSLLMALVYLALAYVTIELLRIYKKPESYALLLLLPSFLYHSLNRFDILPSLLVSLALLLYLKNRYIISSATLVAGFFIKWYPVLLLPIFLSQLWVKNKKAFIKVIAISSGLFFIVFIGSYLWSGKSILDPYLWHISKGFYYESLYYLMDKFSTYLKLDFRVAIDLAAISLQALSIFLPAAAFIRPRLLSHEQLLRLILFILLIFIFFSTGRAPQFNLWFIPLYILVIRDRAGIFLVISFDIINYLFYPVGFASVGGNIAWLNDCLSVIKQLMYLLLFYYLFRPYFSRNKFNP